MHFSVKNSGGKKTQQQNKDYLSLIPLNCLTVTQKYNIAIFCLNSFIKKTFKRRYTPHLKPIFPGICEAFGSGR